LKTAIMDEREEKSGRARRLVGPERIILRLFSPQGPFKTETKTLSAPPTRVWLVNVGATPIEAANLAIDPLYRSEGGEVAPSRLTVEAAEPSIEAGGGAAITIAGGAPARPGVYLSTLRLAEEGSEGVPIEVRVAASPFWGFACLLLGLLLVGTINALDTESGVKGELQGALEARQAAHELLERTPPPQSRAVLVETIDREFDAAVETLQLNRPGFAGGRLV